MIDPLLLKKMIDTLIAYTYCMLCKNIVLGILLMQTVPICSYFVSQKLVKDILRHGILKEWLQ